MDRALAELRATLDELHQSLEEESGGDSEDSDHD